MPMNLKEYQRVLRLHAMMVSSTANPNEARSARNHLLALLASFGKGEQDLDDVVATAQEEIAKAEPPPPSPPPPPDPLAEGDRITVWQLLTALIDQYVALTEEQRDATALWILYTYIFLRQLYMHAPRLLVTSPVPGCGKTTLLKLMKELVARPNSASSITPAAIYRAMLE